MRNVISVVDNTFVISGTIKKITLTGYVFDCTTFKSTDLLPDMITKIENEIKISWSKICDEIKSWFENQEHLSKNIIQTILFAPHKKLQIVSKNSDFNSCYLSNFYCLLNNVTLFADAKICNADKVKITGLNCSWKDNIHKSYKGLVFVESVKKLDGENLVGLDGLDEDNPVLITMKQKQTTKKQIST